MFLLKKKWVRLKIDYPFFFFEQDFDINRNNYFMLELLEPLINEKLLSNVDLTMWEPMTFCCLTGKEIKVSLYYW